MKSASSSDKKIKKMSVDRLSALPDDILCYILSFLEMKQAAITCLLSKRWQFLWTKLPGLRFKEESFDGMEKIRKFVNRVHKILVMYSGINLERFEVDFGSTYDLQFASDVNIWIEFALKNKVKKVRLLLDYMLPQMMYSNPHWTSLTLIDCIVAPRGTIQWQSLTMLRIEFVELNANTFQKILSGCPVLSSLDLWYCMGFNRLEVNSRSLHRLAISDCAIAEELEISAPNIHTLKINLMSRSLLLENIKSLVTAEISIDNFDIEATKSAKSLRKLFENIAHVKKLKLGCDCVKFLSQITLKWEIPQSTRKSLHLHAYRGTESIRGIIALLKSSPNLETLIIHVDRLHYHPRDVFSELTSKHDLDCNLHHLKTVCFKNLEHRSSSTRGFEPMLTLARNLLKKAVVLEKMVVSFSKITASSSTAFYNMTQELLSYPRISQKAVVLLY